MTNALIPVFSGTLQSQSVQLCNARELHAFMGVLRDFTTWIKGRIRKFGFVEGVDYLLTKSGEQVQHQGGLRTVERTDYHLTLDMAKELAMVENNERGRAARKYFIACERELLARTTRPIDPAIDYQRIDPNMAQTLKEEVARIVATGRQGYGETWARLHRKFRVNSYLELAASQYQEALAYLCAKSGTAVSMPQPSAIDPAELLLSGQADPVALTAVQQAMVDHRAWELAGHARELIHAHIQRRIAYRTHIDRRSDDAVRTLVEGTTLGNALTHHYAEQLRTLGSALQFWQASAQKATDRFKADMGRLGVAGMV